MNDTLEWHRVADLDELSEGRVTTVSAGVHTLALTHIDGEYYAMDNHCPHLDDAGRLCHRLCIA